MNPFRDDDYATGPAVREELDRMRRDLAAANQHHRREFAERQGLQRRYDDLAEELGKSRAALAQAQAELAVARHVIAECEAQRDRWLGASTACAQGSGQALQDVMRNARDRWRVSIS